MSVGNCIGKSGARQLHLIAQRLMKQMTGYFGGYVSRRQKIGQFELKKSIAALAPLKTKLQSRQLRASAQLAHVVNHMFATLREGRPPCTYGRVHVSFASPARRPARGRVYPRFQAAEHPRQALPRLLRSPAETSREHRTESADAAERATGNRLRRGQRMRRSVASP